MKKNTMVRVQLEILEFPVNEDEPLEILVWGSDADQPWRRIIGKLESTSDQVWDILTNDKPVLYHYSYNLSIIRNSKIFYHL